MGKHADTRSRSLRVLGLPPATQEGLLQQTLEKLGPVKRVEVFEDKNEAVVEFQNAAVSSITFLQGIAKGKLLIPCHQDVAKLLLSKEAIEFNGVTLTLSELPDAPAAPGSSAKSGAGAAAGGLFVPRTAASRPRAGLGHARKAPAAAAASGAPVAGSSGGGGSMGPPAGGRGQDDFRKMLSGGK